MEDASRYQTQSLRTHLHGEEITHILSAAIRAVEPGAAIRRFVQVQQDQMVVDRTVYPFSETGRVYVAAFGKAAAAMGTTLADLLGEKMAGGLAVCKHLPQTPDPRLTMLTGGHPVPTENSRSAGQALLDLAGGLTEDDILICAISGGGSALVTQPYNGVSLADLQALTQALLGCGARIDEINTLRRHLDRVKGGGLAQAAAPAQVISLILSDVVRSPLEAIASGPTAPDPTSINDAFSILKKYELTGKVPQSIIDVLNMGLETPKPGDKVYDRVQNVLVASNELAAAAALDLARKFGYDTVSLGNAWQGEARETAKELAEKLKTCRTGDQPICLVAGGETTVTIQGHGKGGRNQELALAAVGLLPEDKDFFLVTLATDGEDGPTDAAGAVVTPQTGARAAAVGLAPLVYLDNNDAYHFFDKLDDLLKPGPSGTNVNDLTFLFCFPK